MTAFSTGSAQAVRTASEHVLRLRTDRPLGNGGEGTVYRTEHDRFAVKIIKPGARTAEDLAARLQRLRWLPLEGVAICRPIELLAAPYIGYVMELLQDMVALQEICGQTSAEPAADYAKAGGLRRRLVLLARCAKILSTLHERGIVYGDVSPGNVLVSSRADFDEVWLVDADNLQTESSVAHRRSYTPLYGAPEIVRGSSGNTAASDAFSFAVLAHETLTTNHPFIGDHVADGPVELEENAQLGLLPWIDCSTDDRNRARFGFPLHSVTTAGLRTLFRRAFEDGLADPRARPIAGEWATELRAAADRTVQCTCGQTYFVVDSRCPWCAEHPRPRVLAVTVEERYPALGDHPPVVLPRPNDLLVVQEGRLMPVYARTTGPAENPDVQTLHIEWDGGDRLRTRNVGTRSLWRVSPHNGEARLFYPGSYATDHVNAPWGIHFGPPSQPHRILRVALIDDGA